MDRSRTQKIFRALYPFIVLCFMSTSSPADVVGSNRCRDDCSGCHDLRERPKRKTSCLSGGRKSTNSLNSLFGVSAESRPRPFLSAPTMNPHDRSEAGFRVARLSIRYEGSATKTSSTGLSTEECLSCHDQNRASSIYSAPSTPKVMNSNGDLAGGDFAYETAPDASGKGHSLGSTAIAPGGLYANRTTGLSCNDCHDLDSKNYRYLRETLNGMSVKVVGIGDNDWERTNSRNDHNLYVSGMNKFCGACHGKFYGENNTRGSGAHYIRHPNKAGIPRKSILIGSYDPLYPVEDLSANSTGYRVNTSSSKVFCLTCHRAHASPYPDASRWDNRRASGKDRGCNVCHGK